MKKYRFSFHFCYSYKILFDIFLVSPFYWKILSIGSSNAKIMIINTAVISDIDLSSVELKNVYHSIVKRTLTSISIKNPRQMT